MADQSETKRSKRARRREEEGESAAPEAETATGDGEGSAEGAAQQPAESATDKIREENRRARRAAAARRRQKRDRERQKAAQVGLDTGEMVDDALARGTDALTRWGRRHFNVIQWVIVLSLAGWIGWEIYSWRHDKSVAAATDVLMEGIEAEQGRIGAPADETLDDRRVFETPEARLEAAAEEYRQAAASKSSTTADNAELLLARTLYAQGKFDEASKLYEKVRYSELAKLDPDVLGRSLEGGALCLEGKGDLDGALKKLGELENADIEGYTNLARYHRARLLVEKGDEASRAKATELLLKVLESTSDQESPMAAGYLAGASRDMLMSLDPSKVPQPTGQEALQKALEEARAKLPEGVSLPALPAPRPAPSP